MTQTAMTRQVGGQDFNVLNLQGKAYAPVHQRVEAATTAGGYSIISCEYKEIFERRVCEVWIEYNGKRFVGTAEIKKDFARPLEDAQTSAVGRALGFAGFDIQTAIASAEDMASLSNASVTVEAVDEATPRQIKPAPAKPQVKAKALPEPKAKLPTIAEQCAALAKSIGYDHEGFLDLATQFKVEGKVVWEDMKAQLMQEASQKAQKAS